MCIVLTIMSIRTSRAKHTHIGGGRRYQKGNIFLDGINTFARLNWGHDAPVKRGYNITTCGFIYRDICYSRKLKVQVKVISG